MALEMTDTVEGASLTDAYHKISHVSGNKDGLHVDVGIHVNSSEKAISSFSFKMEAGDMAHDDGASDKNYTKQAYEHMKAGALTDLGGISRDYTSATNV